jgi:hypothetical protein
MILLCSSFAEQWLLLFNVAVIAHHHRCPPPPPPFSTIDCYQGEGGWLLLGAASPSLTPCSLPVAFAIVVIIFFFCRHSCQPLLPLLPPLSSRPLLPSTLAQHCHSCFYPLLPLPQLLPIVAYRHCSCHCCHCHHPKLSSNATVAAAIVIHGMVLHCIACLRPSPSQQLIVRWASCLHCCLLWCLSSPSSPSTNVNVGSFRSVYTASSNLASSIALFFDMLRKL